jgi:phosphatidylglycerophosphatase A
VAIYVLIAQTSIGEFRTLLLLFLLVLACLISVLLGEWAERYWSKKDPRQFVLDEVAGFYLTVLLYQGPSLFWTTLWAFLATRIFDIVKPPPAAQAQRLNAGWGILLDDLLASLYAVGFLYVSGWLFPGIF